MDAVQPVIDGSTYEGFLQAEDVLRRYLATQGINEVIVSSIGHMDGCYHFMLDKPEKLCLVFEDGRPIEELDKKEAKWGKDFV